MGRSTKGADYQNVPRPIAALSDEYPAGFHDPRHRHQRGQLIYASRGVFLVVTDQASFIVPPQRAVWVPPGVPHEAYARHQLSVRTLYLSEAVCADLPRSCRVLEVSDLLRELIVEAARIPIEYDVDGRDGKVMDLILAELRTMHGTPLQVPMPADERLVRVCLSILQDPAQHDALDDWAEAAGMGRRTFTRTFRRETNVSFALWRQQVRLMEALSRLAAGQSVTDVAFVVGYSSSSAFTAMFRRTFGVPPTRFLSEQSDPASEEG
ncbi:MAG: helix-turn-helix transcriptional regulator [Proteobacteria bacterium]|nr:helix-turn-helix transcriptional regulator [Pseudomonadota bacterium]